MKLKTEFLLPTMVLALVGLGGPLKAQLPPDFPGLTVTTCDTNAVGDGYLFLEVTDSSTNGNYYVMILQNDGTPVWSQNVTNQNYDFKVLPNGYLHYADIYYPYPWTGGGNCTHEVLDDNYNYEEAITAGNGYVADSHDFQLLPNGHVLLEGYYLTRMDASKYVAGGYPNALVGGAIIQELDEQRNVVFQWRSWDHFTIPTYFPPTAFTNSAAKQPIIDAMHINAVVMDTDGNLLVSNFGMDVWKINRQTGQIMWRLGGPANQFSFVGINPQLAVTTFSCHTLSRLTNGDILLYCNASQTATYPSKIYEYKLDETNKIATLVWSYTSPTNYYAWHYGSAQRLPNGNTFIGWGGADIMAGIGGVTNQWIPACSEVAANGTLVYQLAFNDPKMDSYRAYRLVYPPASQAIFSAYEGLADGNTYDFDDTGVSLTVEAGGGGYSEVAVTREPYAPVNPQFQGKAPSALPVRISLADADITELDAQIQFDATSLDYASPGNLTVYYRPQTGQGVFLPQTTQFNPAAQTLGVTIAMDSPEGDLGEFIFCYPDIADVPNPPLLGQVESYPGVQTQDVVGPNAALPGAIYAVNQELPILLSWSPQGLARSYEIQIATTSDFNETVLDLTGLTTAFIVWSNAAPNTAYFYRVQTVNQGGSSAWAVGSFQTAPPSISVTAPHGGEDWQRGLNHFIQWNANIFENVVIDLYKGGVFLKSLATAAQTSAYLWQPGFDLAPGNDYSIQITSSTNAALFAASAGPFSLDVPKFTSIQPPANGTFTLHWAGTSDGVYVEFSPTLAPAQWQTVAGPLSGSSWTSAASGPQAGFYRLRLQ